MLGKHTVKQDDVRRAATMRSSAPTYARLSLVCSLTSALLALSVTSCGARPADPSELSALFDRAVYCFGEPYLRARARLRHRRSNARGMLEREVQSPDVYRELTARILLGWLDHEEEFETVGDYIRGSRRVRRPLGLFGRAGTRELILLRRGRYAANVSPHAYLWMYEQLWKVRDLDRDGRTSLGAGLTWALSDPTDDHPPRYPPPDREMAQRLYEFVVADGATRRGRDVGVDADALWHYFQRANDGGASLQTRIRLANLYSVLVSPNRLDTHRPALIAFYEQLMAVGEHGAALTEVVQAGHAWLIPRSEELPHPENTQYRLAQRTEARRQLLRRPLRTCPAR